MLLGRRADEAVVDEQFVVRVGAVCSQDFLTNVCGVSVLANQAGLFCSPVLLFLEASGLVVLDMGIENRLREKKRGTITYHNPSQQQPHTLYCSASR